MSEAQTTTREMTTPADSLSSRDHLVRRLEALLFVSPTPVTTSQLAQALDVPQKEVDYALDALAEGLKGRGVVLQRLNQRVQLVTAPDLATDIERFLGLDLSTRLSSAALETLAIVAYKQPVTRAQIEAVRGVNSDSVLRSLLGKGLIEEVGRLDAVGRPILYGTTFTFLQYFGLESLDDLPPLAEDDAVVLAETLEGALRQMADKGKA